MDVASALDIQCWTDYKESAMSLFSTASSSFQRKLFKIRVLLELIIFVAFPNEEVVVSKIKAKAESILI